MEEIEPWVYSAEGPTNLGQLAAQATAFADPHISSASPWPRTAGIVLQMTTQTYYMRFFVLVLNKPAPLLKSVSLCAELVHGQAH